ncbi:hypothetical protein [Hydrogenophaga sp. PML113]|uniref:hypothetical protein n=1 Tax=Hydrogenophaga sp. PML113 TaxID=1899350 RepID=UPI0008789DF7|nr:hypothetical protein [Hydrogenophaga sp. PML113]OJV38312.1 MAG: hypothetical protein BGO22_14425 [Hydrogenophaga sp. 70-12]
MGRCRFWGLSLAVLALAVALLAAWMAASLALSTWLALAVAGLAWMGWAARVERRLVVGVLRFSGAPGQGAAWRWSPDGCSDGLALDAVRVALDLQSRVLLQLRGSAGAPVWVWVERDRAPADWLALRRALVSDRPV